MPSNKNAEYNRKQSPARKKSDTILREYAAEGKKLDRIAPATPEEARTTHMQGMIHNLQYNPQNLTKSQKYR